MPGFKIRDGTGNIHVFSGDGIGESIQPSSLSCASSNGLGPTENCKMCSIEKGLQTSITKASNGYKAEIGIRDIKSVFQYKSSSLPALEMNVTNGNSRDSRPVDPMDLSGWNWMEHRKVCLIW